MGLLDREYSEKRDFVRMQINTPVHLTVVDNSSPLDGQEYQGLCHDLSGGGMLLSIKEDLPIGQELVVTLMSEHGHSPMLLARCQISRSEPGPKKTNILGLEILEVLNQPEAQIAAV